MIVGLLAALAAAVCYGFGSVLQAMEASRTAAVEGFDVMVLARLLAQWRYLCGLGLDLLGFVAAVVALRTLPLFVVQAAVAGSVGVTALAANRLLHVRLSRREVGALVGLLGGLLLLAASGRPERATPLGAPGPLLLLLGVVPLALVLVLGSRSTGARAGAILAAGAGAAFGAVGIAARAWRVPSNVVHGLRDPLLWAIAAYGVVALLLFASALQRGKVTTVAAVTFAVETVLPAIVGIVWLGDRARAGLAPVAALGFVTTVACSIALARFAEPPADSSPA